MRNEDDVGGRARATRDEERVLNTDEVMQIRKLGRCEDLISE